METNKKTNDVKLSTINNEISIWGLSLTSTITSFTMEKDGTIFVNHDQFNGELNNFEDKIESICEHNSEYIDEYLKLIQFVKVHLCNAEGSGKKYELLTDDSIVYHGIRLYRIRALKGTINVKRGALGGYVENEENLSHDGNSWVGSKAKCYGKAKVYDNAEILGTAEVSGNARAYGNAVIYGNARIYDYAKIYGNVEICGNTEVYEYAKVYGKANVSGNVKIFCEARVYGSATISGYTEARYTRISGKAKVCENAIVRDEVEIYGNAKVYGKANVSDHAKIYENAKVGGRTSIRENARVHDYATVIDVNIFKDMNICGITHIESLINYTCIWGFKDTDTAVSAFRDYVTDEITITCGDFISKFDKFEEQARKYAGDDEYKQECVTAVIKTISQYFDMYDKLRRRKENADDDIYS